jgi:hypothetical protein
MRIDLFFFELEFDWKAVVAICFAATVIVALNRL